MADLLSKLSSYNLLNYLLPGALFGAVLPWVTPFHIAQGQPLTDAFVFYFAGMMLSRIGLTCLGSSGQ